MVNPYFGAFGDLFCAYAVWNGDRQLLGTLGTWFITFILICDAFLGKKAVTMQSDLECFKRSLKISGGTPTVDSEDKAFMVMTHKVVYLCMDLGMFFFLAMRIISCPDVFGSSLITYICKIAMTPFVFLMYNKVRLVYDQWGTLKISPATT